MRILLAQNSVYVPSFGGANKSNRLLLEGLVARGHECHAVVPACGVHACSSREHFYAELRKRRIHILRADHDCDVFELGGVRVTAAATSPALAQSLRCEMREFEPDWIIISSEDLRQTLLEAALQAHPDRVIYLARTTLALPFGPGTLFHSADRTKLLSRVASIVTVSRYLRDYIAQWAGIESTELPISLNGEGPFPDYGLKNDGYILMVNPCAYKGLSIFTQLAAAFPDLPFVAVPTWGTTMKDKAALRQYPNVCLLDPTDNIDEIFAVTRALLVPSLWAEARGRIIVEAMLRGIPVLASDVGGTSEAMFGVDFLLPVNPITQFGNRVDEQMLPVAVVPEQDIGPWRDALRTLIATNESYSRVSRAARAAALAANARQTVLPFEAHLNALAAKSSFTRA